MITSSEYFLFPDPRHPSTSFRFHWSPQSLTREPNIAPSTKVSVLGINVDAICADSLGIATILLLVFLGLWNQLFGFVVWIPTDPVQKGKAVLHRNNDLP
jgi:hypothetical protein